MRVWKANEYLLNCAFWEVVTKMLHCICSNHTDVLKVSWIESSIRSNLFSSIVHQFVSNFKPKDKLFRKLRC
jgi:hypothetical protein